MGKTKKAGKTLKTISIILCVLIAITLAANIHLSSQLKKLSGENETGTKTETAQSNETTTQLYPKQTSLSMVMTGDALVHSAVYKDAKLSGDSYDFTKQIEKIAPIIKQYDLAYYNAETIIGGRELGISTYPCFNTPEEFAEAMLASGFNMMSLSTNHTMDKGEKGIIYSCNYWKTKDVLATGSYLSEQERTTPNIKEKNGIKYTMLSYTMLDNGLKTPEGKDFYNCMYSNDKAKADIERVRGLCDVLIVSIHWGVEYSQTPTAQQRQIAKYLAEQGVNIIIGTHPHVLQPIEFIGDTVVYYSLGNFLSAQDSTVKLTGVLSSLKINKTENADGSKKITLSDFSNELIYTKYNKTGNGWVNFKVYPFGELNETILPGYKNTYAQSIAVLKNLDSSVSVAAIQ